MPLHCQRPFITKNSEVTICSSHKGIIISVACRASGFVQPVIQAGRLTAPLNSIVISMGDSLNIENFLAEREQLQIENERMTELVKNYKSNTPNVTPLWDTTPESIEYNDINPTIVNSGIDIYTASFNDVWNGIYKPSIYDRDTLWKDVHDNRKIARVIEAWENGQKLSPIFFVKHGGKSMALVADGKHRLTAARYMTCSNIPFMIESSGKDWLLQAIPKAKKI